MVDDHVTIFPTLMFLYFFLDEVYGEIPIFAVFFFTRFLLVKSPLGTSIFVVTFGHQACCCVAGVAPGPPEFWWMW